MNFLVREMSLLLSLAVIKEVVAELKASKSDASSDPESKPDKGNGKRKQIIDAEPRATIATAKI